MDPNETEQPAVEPTPAAEPAKPQDNFDLTVGKDGVALKMFGMDFSAQKPSIGYLLSGPIGGAVWLSQQVKNNVTDPLLEKYVQPAIAQSLNEPLVGPATANYPQGMAQPNSPVDLMRRSGAAISGAVSDVTQQPEEQAGQGGADLGEYMLKSGLSTWIGRSPLEKLSDEQKSRAMRELDMINRHPVFSHLLRKMNAPAAAKLADDFADATADVTGGVQEALFGELGNAPLYMLGAKNIAALEGPGLARALARGANTGAQMGGTVAMTTPGADLGEGMATGAVVGALPGVLGKAAAVPGEIRAGRAVAEEARFAGAKTVQGERIPGPGPDNIPPAPREPTVVAVSSDAVKEVAATVHEEARLAQYLARNTETRLALPGGPKAPAFREVPRTDTKFSPNAVTIDMENGIPTLRATKYGPEGMSGLSITLDNPAAVDEVIGLSKRWGQAPIIYSAEVLNAVDPRLLVLGGFKPKNAQGISQAQKPVLGATKADRVRAQLDTNLGDVPSAPKFEAQPGLIVMDEPHDPNFYGGAWQLHQLNSKPLRAKSLQARDVVAVTMPDGSEKIGFQGPGVVIAPAPEEGIAGSLLFDLDVQAGNSQRIRSLKSHEIEALADVEPASLVAERELYKKAKKADSVDQFVSNFMQWRTEQPPELQKLINDYTKRQANKVIKVPEGGTGAVLRDENTIVQSVDSRERVRSALAQQGINGQLADHLLHVVNKLDQGIKPKPMEMRLLIDEWTSAQRGAELTVPDVIGKPSFTEPPQGGRVMLSDGSIATVKAVTADNSKVIVSTGGQTRTVPSQMVVGPVPEVTRAESGPAASAATSTSSEVGAVPASAQPPSEPPPPPITGLPPGGPIPPPPPGNIPDNRAAEVLTMSRMNRLYTNAIPAYSRGPQDLAQLALNKLSVGAMEQSLRTDIYSKLNQMFGPRTTEFQTSLGHYLNGRTDLPASEQLLNKFPEVSMDALAYTDRLKAYSQGLEAKAQSLGMLQTSAADRMDPMHLTNSYLRYFAGPGEWAKIFMKDQNAFNNLVRTIKDNEFKGSPLSQEAIDGKARDYALEMIGHFDKQLGQFATNPGSALKSQLERNLELRPEYQRALGEITDPVAKMAITIGRQEALVQLGSIYRDLRNSLLSSPGDAPRPDVPGWGPWRQLNGGQYGEMNGRWMHPAAHEALEQLPAIARKTSTFATQVLDFIKRNRTMYNPGAWFTNVAGNVQGSFLAGGIDPILHPVNAAKYLAKSLDLMVGSGKSDITSDLGKLLTRARGLGMYAPGLAGSEQGILKDFTKSVLNDMKGNPQFTFMDMMRKFGKLNDGRQAIDHKVGAVYDGVDQATKLANWLSLRDRGLNNPAKFLGKQFNASLPPDRLEQLVEREAARRVATSFPMPHAPSRNIASVRNFASGSIGVGNPFVTMSLEELRILGNFGNRFRGQGGESGAEFTGKMIKLAAYGAGLVLGAQWLRRKAGISDEEVALGKASMSAQAQQYKPGLVPLWYRGPDGNVRYFDATNAMSYMRYASGPPEASLPARVFYNAIKLPVSGSMVEDTIDEMARRSGFNFAPAGTPNQQPNSRQLQGWKATMEMLGNAGLLPGAVGSTTRALNAGGMYGVQPEDPYHQTTKTEAIANSVLGNKIVPGGNPQKALIGKTLGLGAAIKDFAKSNALKPGEQPGTRYGVSGTKEESVSAARDGMQQKLQEQRDLAEMNKKVRNQKRGK